MSVKELGDLLLAIKGGSNQPGQRPPQNVTAEADEVLRPLMDLLDGNNMKTALFVPFELIFCPTNEINTRLLA